MMKIVKAFTAGVVLGILFAPQKGTKTRKRISKIFKDYKEDVKDYAVDVVDKVESKVHSAKKSIKKA
ncbi:MAG: YtxH domain-containing protein [Ginsengibacter sp.]